MNSVTYTGPSPNSSDNSPPMSNVYFSSSPFSELGLEFLGDGFNDPVVLRQLNEKLRIVAQPKAFYRERYCSETDPSKHRAQRFIRSDDETSKYEYPTVHVRFHRRDPTHVHSSLQIPSEWFTTARELYIRVTLVTVVSDKVPVVCVHPYTIDTQENGVLRDASNNSLFFPVTGEEAYIGTKRCCITRGNRVLPVASV